MNSPTGRPVDGFSRLMAQTTRTRARVCLLGVSLILLPTLREKSPSNPLFLGREQALWRQTWKIFKVSYYRNYFIDFNQILHSDRDHQVVIVCRPNTHPSKSKMADGRHFGQTVKWPYLCNRLTDFDEIWQGDACWPLSAQPATVSISNFWISKMAILKNYKNRDISATVCPMFTKLGTMTQNMSFHRSDR